MSVEGSKITPELDLVPAPGTKGQKLAGAGLLLLIAGVILGIIGFRKDIEEFSSSYLWGFVFLWTIVIGSLFFVALQHVTGSYWSVVYRRIAEMYASPMLIITALFVPILLFVYRTDVFHLFPWLEPEQFNHHEQDILKGKAPYLNACFFSLRGVFYFLVWSGFAFFFIGKSLKQDEGIGGIEATLKMRKYSPIFLMLFALTISFAGFDWIMSLEPFFFSTMFGVYIFAGMFVTALAVISITAVWLESEGLLGENVIKKDHVYNLGFYLFTFSCFWAYIAFSQYMLIWYGNMPEETFYYHIRLNDGSGWYTLMILLMLVRFFVPFALLLGRRSKMNRQRLVIVSVLVIFGQLLDLYLLIFPKKGVDMQFSLTQLGAPLVAIGILLIFVSRFMAKHRMMAMGDPMLEDSKNYHL